MARRKNMTPPFEIMGKTAPRRPSHERGEGGGDAVSQGEVEAASAAGSRVGKGEGERGGSLHEGLAPRQWKQWLTHSGPPLVLRVPRGLALAVVAGVLGLLVLSYWVGIERGRASAEGMRAGATPSVDRFARVPGVPGDAPDPAGESGEALGARGGGGEGGRVMRVGDAGDAGDPREPGLNYLLLATWNPADAERLAAFLASYGVATLLEPWNNERLRVWAIDRGFAPDEVDPRRAYRREMLEVGRAWKRHNNGRGTALTDMYFEKFDGG